MSAEIRAVIREVARRRQRFTTADVRKALGRQVSRQYLTRLLTAMVTDGTLIKEGTTRGASYAHARRASELRLRVRKRLRNVSLREDEIWDEIRHEAPFLPRLKPNVDQILSYAFLEMLNNAIEHSRSPVVEVEVMKSGRTVSFIVEDFGVGVFRHVMKQRGLNSEFEAMQDLLKGKTTTAPKAHSGEGIFFTSKLADVFTLESFSYVLRVDNRIDDVFIERGPMKRGTRVSFVISERTAKRLDNVFSRFATVQAEPAFDKSEVRVKLFARGVRYLSRSEARRLLAGLEKFRSIVLDFAGVDSIGQAFADEIFRVFRRSHPKITVIAVHANEIVQFMIDRAYPRVSGAGTRLRDV